MENLKEDHSKVWEFLGFGFFFLNFCFDKRLQVFPFGT